MSTVFLYLFLIVITALSWNIRAISQDIFWRDYVPTEIPCDAIEAAPGRYIGQAYHGGFMVATLYPYSNSAIFDFAGKKAVVGNLKVLCSHQPDKLYWEKVNFSAPHDAQMTDVVKGGNQAGQFDLYIGKIFHEGEWKIGKVVEITHASKGLWIWDKAGKGVQLFEFQILKFNMSTFGCGRRVF